MACMTMQAYTTGQQRNYIRLDRFEPQALDNIIL